MSEPVFLIHTGRRIRPRIAPKPFSVVFTVANRAVRIIRIVAFYFQIIALFVFWQLALYLYCTIFPDIFCAYCLLYLLLYLCFTVISGHILIFIRFALTRISNYSILFVDMMEYCSEPITEWESYDWESERHTWNGQLPGEYQSSYLR